MSRGNVYFELSNGIAGRVPSTVPTKVIMIQDATYDKLCIFGYVNGAPGTYAVASDGYTKDFAKGCVMVDTANGGSFSNSGTVAAPTWSGNIT